MLTVNIDNNSGFCAGVIKAISTAEEFLKKNHDSGEEGKRLYSLGAIVHNDAELNRLVSQGLVTIDKEDLEEMVNAKGEYLLIRAHGEPPQTYMTAERLGMRGTKSLRLLMRILRDLRSPGFLSLRTVIFGFI